MSVKVHLLALFVACGISSCDRIDRQFQGANYSHFGSAVYTECEFIQRRHIGRCVDVSTCVNYYMLDHDNTGPSSFFPAYAIFTEGLIEFIYNKASIFDEKGGPVKPQGKIPDSQRFLEYRIRTDGTILRWSPDVGDWATTGRNIRDESLPARVYQLIDAAKRNGDGEALKLYELFLEARSFCYLDPRSWAER